jgi:membrane protein DedA with SNARE-associated domain
VGENYAQIEAALKPFEYLIYAVILVLLVALIGRWWWSKRRRP